MSNIKEVVMNTLKLFITPGIFLMSVLFGFAQKSTIHVEISGKAAPAVKEVQIYVNAKTEKALPDQEPRLFKAEIDLIKPQFVEIKTGGNVTNFIYMLPGENAKVKIEKRTLNENIVEISEGKIRNVNEAMDRFYATFTDNGISTLANRWVENLFGRPALIDQAMKNGLEVIDQNEHFFNSAAPGFKSDFLFFTESFRNYCLIDEYSMSELEGILENISSSDMPLSVLTIPFYRDYLVDLTNAYAARKIELYNLSFDRSGNANVSQAIAAEACVEFIPNQSVLNYLFYDKINRELSVNGIKNLNYVDFLFAHAEESVTKNFSERYKTLKENSGGGQQTERIPAIDFEFQDAEGKVYRLADFRGKMLMIDFWASWCAPCKVQLPFFKELEKHYQGKDIVFAKVSLDNTKQAWLKGVESEGLTGVVLHAPGAFKNAFPVHYGITAIPRFMLIDAEGNMISENMPKPQNKEEVMALIDADLFKAELRQILDKHYLSTGAGKLSDANVLKMKIHQSFMGIEIDHEIRYNYPRNFRHDNQAQYNETFALAIGEDFFKPRFLLIEGDSVRGNFPNMSASSGSWMNSLPGFDLFILDKVMNVSLDFAEENFTNSDNHYVIKASFDDKIEKYFIDKQDYLIRRVTRNSNAKPRQGGGTSVGSVKYEDYANVNGIMVPHRYSVSNILNYKITDVALEPLNGRSFKSLVLGKN